MQPDDPMDALPQDSGVPVFQAPWEAKAFALQLALFEAGAFSWKEWAAHLGAEIAIGDAHDDEEGSAYFRYWLRALEGLIVKKNIAPETVLARTASAWIRAAERTPHGQPIELDTGENGQ